MPDPFDYHVSGTPTTIEFYAYRPHLSLSAAEQCCQAAKEEAQEHTERGEANVQIGTVVRAWDVQRSHTWLVVKPDGRMTWGNLWALAEGTQRFLSRNPFQFQFRVLVQGFEGQFFL